MRRIGASVVLIAALAVAGCGRDERASAPATATARQQETAATATLSLAARSPRVERLRCRDGGTLPNLSPSVLRPGWRRRSVIAGPLTLFYARDLARQPAAAFRPERAILRGELRRARDPRVRRRIERTLRRMPRDGAWLVADAEDVAGRYRAGELDVMDLVRQFGVIVDWGTGELFPRTTETFRAMLRRRAAAHWAPAPTTVAG